MTTAPENGALKNVAGVLRVFYDGYWIRCYEPPPESWSAKKHLIDALTRRAFHHTEAGINTPGEKLEAARAAWQRETEPHRKRVNAAMLAGALFNRATDIFTSIVDLEERGVGITMDNKLMRQCADCFSEAQNLSGQVKHCSGEVGIDELWGEPGKAFTMTIAEYYHSRYRKIAQAMRDIDQIGAALRATLCSRPCFAPARPLVDNFIEAAKEECEIFRSDADYYRVWPAFVAYGEKLLEYRAPIPPDASPEQERHLKRGIRLLHSGKNIIVWIANARVPMPASTGEFFNNCEHYRAH